MALNLRITEWQDETRWRWVLEDGDGRFVADHTVRLDPASGEYRGFVDVAKYLDYHAPVLTAQAQLQSLGRWIGERVFGGLRGALQERANAPAEAVQVHIPSAAQGLLARPFELACFDDGTRFDEAGLRFVYQTENATPKAKPGGEALRVLAVFSLPVQANPLNLRRERYQLQQRVRRLNRTQGAAVELRVLQYGATQETLREALQDGKGWDLVHLSGHGLRGEFSLETAAGGEQRLDAAALGKLLALSRKRLKLLILDACYSGAASHAAARVQVGLDAAREAGTQDDASAAVAVDAIATPLPSLGFALAGQLDCAVLAMRYPVGDSFATELMLALYEKLLEQGQPLPAALQLALGQALAAELVPASLAEVTPILLGSRAAALELPPPKRPPGPATLPTVGLSIGFPKEPERFVGRLQPMLRASQVLAPQHAKRAVLFHGMPGAGKSACALELAYRHEERRFAGYVWYQAPEAGSDIGSSLFGLMHEIQRQLNAPELGLTTALDDQGRFRDYTLPRLRALLQENACLLVLDNLETLLTESNEWRIALWGEVIAAMLDHEGDSRVVLTSRRVPAALAAHPRLQIEPIHALSFAESVLLARELPGLKRLFADDPGLALLRQTLRVVQGHPKLLHFADALAADRDALGRRVAAAAAELDTHGEVLEAFFTKGGAHEGESQQHDTQFLQALQGWTAGILERLSPTAQLLFVFLCRIEADDRTRDSVQANWGDVLSRLGPTHAPAVAALAEPEGGLTTSLAALRAAGLIDVVPPAIDPQLIEMLQQLSSSQSGAPQAAALQQLLAEYITGKTGYAIHPGVAEAALGKADATLLEATDIELGNYFIAAVLRGLEGESEGGGERVVNAARRGVPYLMRTERWQEASTLLAQLLNRDESPDAVDFSLSVLDRIVAATVGSDRELNDSAVLANALLKAGRHEEAEARMRDIIARARANGDRRLASIAAGDLANLLKAKGRWKEALEVIAEKAEDMRSAGLGPWTQLVGEGTRLQVLVQLGRHEEVLEALEHLRPHMAALPEKSDADESTTPWNARELLLDVGRAAALRTERWQLALELNAEVFAITQARGAEPLELARTRFNDYGPLLRLERFDDARTLLQQCRKVFEEERSLEEIGAVYGALANLEAETGDPATAMRFERLALDYKYQRGSPDQCAISHHNLSNYLARAGGDPSLVLAHRLADAVICLQIGSGGLSASVRNLARTELPEAPPTFAQVVMQVETVPGVRLAALFERLPRSFPDGDVAMAELWKLVGEERARRSAAQGEHNTNLLSRFEPILLAIAAVARGDDSSRSDLEELLPKLESKGFKLVDPVQRIWAGEREAAVLVRDLDEADSLLVLRLLDLLRD